MVTVSHRVIMHYTAKRARAVCSCGYTTYPSRHAVAEQRGHEHVASSMRRDGVAGLPQWTGHTITYPRAES